MRVSFTVYPAMVMVLMRMARLLTQIDSAEELAKKKRAEVILLMRQKDVGYTDVEAWERCACFAGNLKEMRGWGSRPSFMMRSYPTMPPVLMRVLTRAAQHATGRLPSELAEMTRQQVVRMLERDEGEAWNRVATLAHNMKRRPAIAVGVKRMDLMAVGVKRMDRKESGR
jgi:hypothetical protein